MSIQMPTRPFLENKKLNKIEQNKAAKDGLLVGDEIEEFARIGWEEVDETDLQLRLKWYDEGFNSNFYNFSPDA